MKIIVSIIRSLMIFFIIGSQAFAEYPYPESETYQQKTIEKKTETLRSTLTCSFKKKNENHYFFKKTGEGNYGPFQKTSWVLESEIRLQENLLCPLHTTFSIKENEGQAILTYKNVYDYDKKIILTTHGKSDSQKIETFNFPLKNPTTDYATLIYFLRPFIPDLLEGETIHFNFLSFEPGLYKLKAHFVNEERLPIGPDEIETIKIAITPDMGSLNIILNKFVPPTLLWYRKKAPHILLKYEGLESGRKSDHIITTSNHIMPF